VFKNPVLSKPFKQSKPGQLALVRILKPQHLLIPVPFIKHKDKQRPVIETITGKAKGDRPVNTVPHHIKREPNQMPPQAFPTKTTRRSWENK